jgi:hypothetical protein
MTSGRKCHDIWERDASSKIEEEVFCHFRSVGRAVQNTQVIETVVLGAYTQAPLYVFNLILSMNLLGYCLHCILLFWVTFEIFFFFFFFCKMAVSHPFTWNSKGTSGCVVM